MKMTTLSLASGNVGNKDCFLECPSLYFAEGPLASKLLKSSYRRRGYGFWSDDPKFPRIKSRNKFCVSAKVKKWRKHDYPWPDDMDPNIESGHLSYLSYFKPLTEKPKPVTLPFEKPLVDLEKKIIEIRNLADETGLDFSNQIGTLENKYQMALKDLYTHLSPIQRLSLARHPNRPTVLDHILNITEKWIELHGDRAGYDDPAIVTGIGSIEGKSYMCIGHQKGRSTKENIARNFAMPTPHGYRKALRMMKYADHHGLPILTFVDTPGAFADLKSEELGQGEAIANNLRTMFGLKVPIVTVVTGEGGSGGALAIACSNKMFMMENSAFYVASPEACAAILWKSSQAAPKAAEKLKITAQEHYRLKIADGIIPEPLGGAHADPLWASQQIKSAIIQAMKELSNMSIEELLHHRMLKYRHIGGFQEGVPIDPQRKRRMKPSQTGLPKASDIESELEDLKKKILKVKGPSDPITAQAIEKLKQDVDKEITDAFISMGLQGKLESLKLELSKAPNGSPNQPLNRNLKEKVDKLAQEFKQNFLRHGSYLGLKQKLGKLDMVNNLIEQKKKSEELKEINSKIPSETKAKLKQLKNTWDSIVTNGAPVDGDLTEEIERIKTELVNVLKAANLDVVEVVKKTAAAPPAEVREKMQRLKEEIDGEIERAIEIQGLGGKIEELKAKMADGLNLQEVEKLEAEIKEKIVEALEASALKEKVEILRMDVALSMAAGAEGMVAVDNGRS